MTKTIHYCWFGENEKNDEIKRCIKTWKTFCPNYKIIEWNEKNFNINICAYVKEAYSKKKWAFVSDYCRYWVLYNYGGIYLDTDVELIRKIDDLPDNFVGFENKNQVASGLIRGAKKKNSIIKQMLDSYENDHFINEDGTLNTKTVCERETELLKRKGLKTNGKQQVVENTTIYPKDYFSPLEYRTKKLIITNNTYSIHWYSGSWQNERQKYANIIEAKLSKIMPNKIASIISMLYSRVKYYGLNQTVKYIKKKIWK